MPVLYLLLLCASTFACRSAPAVPPAQYRDFYNGVDLSYVNEVEDAGGVYRKAGQAVEPFALFAAAGANLVRARLWNDATWTAYSDEADVARTFSRAKAAGLATLLDFHYSDDWADPGKQFIPAAWKGLDEDALVKAVESWTYGVLGRLAKAGLLPDFVQIGNETNNGILKAGTARDWARDARLFNAGIAAARRIGAANGGKPRVLLHVAQPENALGWFAEAEARGVVDFDAIGLSYYPQWSVLGPSAAGAVVGRLKARFGKDVMIVETAYPWTRDTAGDSAANILTESLRGYPVSPAGQARFMADLTQIVKSSGGLGVVYWEPAWIPTAAKTRWGVGSHWENAIFFDFKAGNEVHAGIGYLAKSYRPPAFPAGLVAAGGALPGVPRFDLAGGLGATEAAAGAEAGAAPPRAELDLTRLVAASGPDALFLALETAGDLMKKPGGGFLLLLDAAPGGPSAGPEPRAASGGGAAPTPDYALEILLKEKGGQTYAYVSGQRWNGAAWEEWTPSGAIRHSESGPFRLELELPWTDLGYPDAGGAADVGVAALSVPVYAAGAALDSLEGRAQR
jgi:arabinogalactan endo-1,4-beta-galactosidase